MLNSEAVGSGAAAFKYLAPYIFRVAISNNRILKLENGRVTFKYKESATAQIKTATVSAEEFIHRFLQHVLPHRFVKVRYYGLLAPSNRHLLQRLRVLLGARCSADHTPAQATVAKQTVDPRCLKCGSVLLLVETLPRQSRAPP